jgi:hypothetical protein
MKNLVLFVVLFLTLVCVDAGLEPAASRVAPGEDFSLRFGEKAIVQGTNLTIEFADVGSDSRCPADVMCIWAGNAEVRLEILGLDSLISVVLNTTEPPASAVVAGYEIMLKQLDPYPVSTKQIEKKDYIATLRIVTPVR